MQKTLHSKICPTCLTPFDGVASQIYCEPTCRQSRIKLRPWAGLVEGTVGALGELKVAADLMLRGFEVFRALSPSCSADLVIHKDGLTQRVEVRTGVYAQSGSRVVNDKTHRADILAIAYPNEVSYEPPLRGSK